MLKQISLLLKSSSSSKNRERGDRLRDSERFEEAAASYRKYLDTNPNDFNIWVQAGNSFKEANFFAEAKASYDEAMKIKPSDADLHVQMGHLAKLTNNETLARDSYRKALELDGSNVDAASELEKFEPIKFELSSIADTGNLDHLPAIADTGNSDYLPASRLHIQMHARSSSASGDIDDQLSAIKKTLLKQ